MKVLLLGASGYLGARIFKDLDNDFEIIPTHHRTMLWSNSVQLDITNFKQINEVFDSTKPDVVIHTANNGSGGWCNSHPEEAKRLNETATQYVVEATNRNNATLIYISSFAAINPSDVYGMTKRNSEEAVKNVENGWIILRPSLIVGISPNTENDRPFNRILRNVTEKVPAIYDTSWKFQPTYIGHISLVIKKLLENNDFSRKIIPIVISDIVDRYQIANEVLNKFNIEVKTKDEGINIPVIKTEPAFFDEYNIKPINFDELVTVLVDEVSETK